MGAEIDRLEVQIEAEAAKASKQLDDIVKKLGLLAEGISAIKSNKGLEDFASKAKDVSKSIQSVQSKAKEMAKSIDEPMKKVSKSLRQLEDQYGDLGKDFQFFGNAQSTQKKLESLSNAYETAKLRKQELEASGKTNGQMYENAVKDVIKYKNMIESLQSKLEEISNEKFSYPEPQISKYENDITKHLRGIGAYGLLDDYIKEMEEAEQNIAKMSEKSSQAAQGIKDSFAQVSEPLKEIDLTLADFSMKATEALSAPQEESKRFSANLNGLKDVLYGIQDRFLEFKGKLENTFVSKGLKTYTSEYVELQNQITKTEKTLATLNAQMSRSRETVKNFEGTTSYRKMQYDIKAAKEELQRLREEQDRLEVSGGATKWSFKGLASDAKSLTKTLHPLQNALKKILSTINSVLSKVGKLAKSMISLGTATKKSNASFSSGLKTILKYGFGIRSLYVLFNKLRNAIKEGMENLIQYSDRTNASVSMLSSSLNQLKNASAAAIAPLLNAIAPALNTLIQLFIKAANAVNQFFSALTGNGTWIKAKYVYEDVAAGISDAAKAAKGALQPFDALNNLTTQDNSGSGVNPVDMFETVPVEDKFKDLADWIKDMWKDADFYDLGRLLGEKLRNALESIPWSKIKKTLRKIAKSIATFLNGFLETPGLFRVIGKTVAEGINSAFEFLDEFVWDFHWKSLGQAIVDTVQGVIDNLDWDVISSAITGFAYGLADLFNTIFGSTETWGDLGTTIAKAINVALQGMYLFVHNFDWDAFGTSIGTFLGNALRSISWWKLGDILSTGINGAFTSLFNFCETFPWIEVADSIAYGINNALEKLDWEKIKGAVKSLATNLGEWINEFISEIDWEEVGKTIGNIIQLGLDFVYTLKDTIDWTKVKDALHDVLKSAIESIDMGELAKLILTLLAAEIAIKAVPSIFASAGKAMAKSIVNALMTNLKSVDFGLSAGATGMIFEAFEHEEKVKKYDDIFSSMDETVRQLNEDLESGKITTDEYNKLVEQSRQDIADMFNMPKEDPLKEIKDSFTDGSWKGALDLAAQDVNDFCDNLLGIDTEPLYKQFQEIKDSFTDGSWKGAALLAGQDIKDGISEKWNEFSDWWSSTAISNWWENSVSPWFTKEKWSELGTNIKEGISEKWNEFLEWWDNSTLVTWWTNSVEPWFTAEKWNDLYKNIKDSLIEKWNEAKTEWSTSISEWWNNYVTPWFTKEKWVSAMNGIKTAFKEVWNSAISSVKEIWNKFASSLNSKLNISIPAVKVGGKTISESMNLNLGKIPTFSTGGFPEDGLFMANHGELVGQFSNGKTAVANNEQITEGIAIAVRNANSEQNALLREQNQLLRAILEKEGSGVVDIFDTVRSEYQSKAKQLGVRALDPVLG